jgi:hypothetical protein
MGRQMLRLDDNMSTSVIRSLRPQMLRRWLWQLPRGADTIPVSCRFQQFLFEFQHNLNRVTEPDSFDNESTHYLMS